jgi:non-ribosomal peptide synthetase component E (peptide arylation enzyme)
MIPRVFARGQVKPVRFAVRTVTRLSYAKGADTPSLSNETLPSFYEKELLTKFAARPALVSRHEPSKDTGYLRWSFEELWKQANDLARGLIGLGVTKGTRVGVVMGNNRYEIHTINETLFC